LREGMVIEKGSPEEISTSRNYRELFRIEDGW